MPRPIIGPSDRSFIEDMVDLHGLANVLSALSSIADDKAEHIQSNWQDEALAKQWGKVSGIIYKAANNPHITTLSR